MVRIKIAKNKAGGTSAPQNSEFDIDHPLRLAHDAVDAQAIRNLKDALGSFRSCGLSARKIRSPFDWTREDAIGLLRVINDFIVSITSTPMPSDSADLVIIAEHEAASVLQGLIDALGDLDYGRIDGRLKAAEGQGGAALKASERKAIIRWLNAVEILRRHEKIAYPKAQSKVAKSLKMKHRGKIVTASMLRAWKKAHSVKRQGSK